MSSKNSMTRGQQETMPASMMTSSTRPHHHLVVDTARTATTAPAETAIAVASESSSSSLPQHQRYSSSSSSSEGVNSPVISPLPISPTVGVGRNSAYGDNVGNDGLAGHDHHDDEAIDYHLQQQQQQHHHHRRPRSPIRSSHGLPPVQQQSPQQRQQQHHSHRRHDDYDYQYSSSYPLVHDDRNDGGRSRNSRSGFILDDNGSSGSSKNNKLPSSPLGGIATASSTDGRFMTNRPRRRTAAASSASVQFSTRSSGGDHYHYLHPCNDNNNNSFSNLSYGSGSGNNNDATNHHHYGHSHSNSAAHRKHHHSNSRRRRHTNNNNHKHRNHHGHHHGHNHHNQHQERYHDYALHTAHPSSDWSITSEHSTTSYSTMGATTTATGMGNHNNNSNTMISGRQIGGIRAGESSSGAYDPSSSSSSLPLSQTISTNYLHSSSSSLYGLSTTTDSYHPNTNSHSTTTTNYNSNTNTNNNSEYYDGKTKQRNPQYPTSVTTSFGSSSSLLGGGGRGDNNATKNSNLSSSSSSLSLLTSPRFMNSSNNHNQQNQQQQQLPSLQSIMTELIVICSLKCRYTIRSFNRPCRQFRRRVLYCITTVLVVVVVLVSWLVLDFYFDAVDICTPPPPPPLPSSSQQLHQQQRRQFDAFLSQMNNVVTAGNSENGNYNDFNNIASQSKHGRPSDGSLTRVASNQVNDNDDEEEERPLVEYYVHGRGIGHYARSVAIVEQLNRAGVDVRLFLTRSAMWRATHEDSKMVDGTAYGYRDDVTTSKSSNSTHGDDHGKDNNDEKSYGTIHPSNKHRGRTTAISVSSLTPDQSIFDVISHVVERVSGDCEVSATSDRYPQLIISDGDFPGMLRAEFGGIPSVGIAHGQLFSIAQKPSWVQSVPILNRAWNKQGRLNYVSGFFTEWQIATHFCFLESQYSSGTVARAPLRPEVLKMAEARKAARNGSFDPDRLPQQSRIKKLLIHDLHHDHTTQTISGSLKKKPTKQKKNKDPKLEGRGSATTTPPRKLVICYFRDHNGEIVVQALLDAGFDVLLFDTGYYRDMQNDPNRYGVKWIVNDRDEARRQHIRVGGDDVQTGQERRRRLLEDATEVSMQNATAASRTQHRRLAGTANGPRLIRITDRSLFVPLMHVADGVASSAGSQLMSECIYSHMPLLALYKELDDEQRLNVELSHHTDAPCHRPLVFGTSFEGMTSGLRQNSTLQVPSSGILPDATLGKTLDSFNKFVQEVRASPTSETYFRSFLDESSSTWDPSGKMNSRAPSAVDGLDLDKDPFQGLPDAAAIILEIVKQVIQK